MLENTFCKMCVMICGRFSIDDILLFSNYYRELSFYVSFYVFIKCNADIHNWL